MVRQPPTALTSCEAHAGMPCGLLVWRRLFRGGCRRTVQLVTNGVGGRVVRDRLERFLAEFKGTVVAVRFRSHSRFRLIGVKVITNRAETCEPSPTNPCRQCGSCR